MTLPCGERSNVAVRPDKLGDSSVMPVKPKAVDAAGAVTRRWQNRMYALFVLIVLSCAFGLFSVASLIQRQDRTTDSADDSASALARLRGANPVEGKSDTQALVLSGTANIPIETAAPVATPQTSVVVVATTPAPALTFKKSVAERWRELGDDLSQYECVAWRRTSDCSPLGKIEEQEAKTCSDEIPDGVSGFCEIRRKDSGALHRVLEMYCDSLRPGVRFKCSDFREMLEYGRNAPLYTHDATFSFDKCREELVNDQALTGVTNDAALAVAQRAAKSLSYSRGIALVVYEKILESVFASIRSLRAMGCTLPIELWYIASETNVLHPILQALTREHGAFLREIKDVRATRFYTKLHAVFYSAFDEVLLLDSDNFAVRDPSFLFDTREFRDTGAVFWPDFWRAKKTIFNIQPRSFVWDVFDLDYVDAFEQESGQVLVDRRRHLRALNAMMYYAVHPELVENLRLVWGDKDLFRFAWMKTNSSFHMIAMPPGAAGRKLPDKNVFCGVTMVQHDANHEILFLHRNQEKLSSTNHRVVWEHVQDFRIADVSVDEYDVRGANGGRYYPDYKRCYGKDIYYEKLFTVTPVALLPFAGLEASLLSFAAEAAELAKNWTTTPEPDATGAETK